jgi:hypothetical protein
VNARVLANATSVLAIKDWTLELVAALEADDRDRAARAAATISQAVHEVQLDVDPHREHCAAITLNNGVYDETRRPAAALAAELDEPVPYCLAEPVGRPAPRPFPGVGLVAEADLAVIARGAGLTACECSDPFTAVMTGHGHACPLYSESVR